MFYGSSMLLVFKAEVKNGKVRRAAGRPKNVKEKQPRLPKGTKAEIKAFERAQAQQTRLAALKRRQVLDALGDTSLPAGSSINDLTPLQATEIAMQRQGMMAQAQQLAAEEAALREQQAARADALNIANEQSARDRAIQDEIIRLQKTSDPMDKLLKTLGAASAAKAKSDPAASTVLRDAATILSPATKTSPRKLPSPPSKSAPAPRRGRSAKKQVGDGIDWSALAYGLGSRTLYQPTQMGGGINFNELVHGGLGLRDYGQSGDGLDPLRVAMNTAEAGDVEGAMKQLRTLQRNRLDPMTKAKDYIMSLQ